MFSMFASEYNEVYARNNKRPKCNKEEQRMLEPSVRYEFPRQLIPIALRTMEYS